MPRLYGGVFGVRFDRQCTIVVVLKNSLRRIFRVSTIESARRFAAQGARKGSALAGEIARSDKPTRALATEQMRNDIQLIASWRGARNGENDHAARSQAILTF
jgi:hypothetical protein